jgi:hypothetical protein
MSMTASWPPIPSVYKVAADAPRRDGELRSDRSGRRCDPGPTGPAAIEGAAAPN